MAAAADLQEAASLAYGLIATHWQASTLPAAFSGFNDDVAAVFPSGGGDNTMGERTVSNWLVNGRAVQNEIPPVAPLASYLVVNQASQYVYSICWAADNAQGAGRITGAQGAAILAAFNANF